jgi:hypothetical protein
MQRSVFKAMLVLGSMVATGCYAHFDVAGTRASYAASANDPTSQECASRVISAQESFNAYGRWWQRSVVTGIVLGVAIGAVAIVTARDTPGDHATTVAQAVDSERAISGLEVTTAALAALAGADAVLAWFSTTGMSEQAKDVADHLAQCPPRATATPAAPATPPP